MPRIPAIVSAAAILAAVVAHGFRQPPAARRAQVVIVVDGLRPDYVTEAVMPRLVRLGRRGMVFTAHHSVVPTVTRVNAASMVTGVYPEGHGLLGNTIYVPAADARSLDTGVRENLVKVANATGRLLTAPTLGEILTGAGRTLFTVGSGSSGAVFMLDTTGSGTAVHQEFARPPAIASRIADALGPPPPHATPNAALNRRAVDAFLMLGLGDDRPDVTLLWLSDPDTTAHAKGMGAPATVDALKLVDAEIGRVEDALRARGLLDLTNLLVVSDHGFSTYTSTLKLDAAVAPFARPAADGTRDIAVAEGAIYLRGAADPARLAAVVAALQKNPAVGAIFTRSGPRGGPGGGVPGTLSYDVVRWNHPRSGDILVSPNWTNAKNDAGWPGTSTQNGVAGHGASSPYDIHNTLIAAGPDIREHEVSGVPTGNVDLAPTLLRLAGLQPLPAMTGRVIEEAFRDGRSPGSIRVEHATEAARTADGSYSVVAHISIAAGHRYLDYTEVTRRP
jgi:arylsulfatase A-like enzyme